MPSTPQSVLDHRVEIAARRFVNAAARRKKIGLKKKEVEAHVADLLGIWVDNRVGPLEHGPVGECDDLD